MSEIQNIPSAHSEVTSISNMLKPCKVLRDAKKRRVSLETVINRYLRTYKHVNEIEDQIYDAITECKWRTTCFLRGPYPGARYPDYAISLPFTANARMLENHTFLYKGIEEWQVVLAEFYAEEATRLLREREPLLKRLYALASEIYERGGRPPYSLTAEYYPHLRQPWFEIKEAKP